MNFHTPYPPKILITPIRGTKTYLICHLFSLRIKLTQKSKHFNPYKIISHMQQLTHTPIQNPSTNVHVNQQSIYDINIQRQKIYKGMLIANTLKDKLNSQQTTNASWLLTMIKAILKTSIQKFEKPIYLFRRTCEVAVRNRKILAAIKRWLRRSDCRTKEHPSRLRIGIPQHSVPRKIVFYHENKVKIINIIQQGSRYYLDPIFTSTYIYRKLGGAWGGPGINPPPPHQDRQRQQDGGVGSEWGGPGNKTNPPHQERQRQRGGGQQSWRWARGQNTDG